MGQHLSLRWVSLPAAVQWRDVLRCGRKLWALVKEGHAWRPAVHGLARSGLWLSG